MTDNQEDVPLSHEVILFPAFNIGNSELYYFLKSIENSGLLDKVLLVCTKDFLSEYDIMLKHQIIDEFDSFPALIRKIESLKKEHLFRFKGVLGIDEELQFQLSKKLARHFELDFFDDVTCLLASNKFLLKSAFRKHGVPTSPFVLLAKPDREQALRLGFPNVLKVLSGTASHYVFYNEDMDELKENFRRLRRALGRVNGDPRFKRQHMVHDGVGITLDPKRQFLLEAHVPGEEFSCDFMVESKQVYIIRVTKKIKGPYFGYFRGYHLLNEEGLVQNNIDKSRLVSVCRKISRALSIRAGVCMVDFKSRGGKITVLEASIRPGLSAFNHLMYDVYGYTSLALMAMQKMGVPICVEIPEKMGAVIYQYEFSAGDLGQTDTGELEDLKRRFNDAATHTFRDAPDCAIDSEFDHSSLLKGYTLLRNTDAAALSQSAGPADDGLHRRVEEPVQ
jgi:hypothetical protein